MSVIVNFNARRIPSPLGALVTLDVLVRSVDGYRVYTGIVPDNSLQDPDYSEHREWVKANGSKLQYEDACRSFPCLPKAEYVP